MKNVFGTQTTSIENISIQEAIALLSGDAEALLCHVLLELDANELKSESNRTVDTRGVEILTNEEFFEDAIEELKESGLVLFHDESNDSVNYLSLNKDVFYAAINAGVYQTFDLCG